MTLFALLTALLLAHFQPWVWSEKLRVRGGRYGNFFQHHFNAGAHQHGRLAWWVAMLPALILLAMVSVYLANNAPVLSVLLNIAVLYACMGFRLFSLDFAVLQNALREDKLEVARALLAKHSALPTHTLTAAALANLAIQYALAMAQRKVFGVMLWFVVFSLLGLGGATGAVLYRLSNFLRSHWTDAAQYGEFSTFAQQVWQGLNWLPQRLMAIIFAIVGDFEDALEGWRSQAASWPDALHSIVLASAAGAVGTRLSTQQNEQVISVGVGDPADADAMQSITGLLWRTMLFWLGLLLLLSIARVLH
ncbi:MAG: cobalamin biosynthesis protein [Sideroxydans sp.]|nr:cobalamin biosynthesis protein [Sideroxydans sp.]